MHASLDRRSLLARAERLLAALCALSPLGCMSCMSAAIDQSADARVAEVRADTEAAVVDTSCSDGRPLGPNCGLVMRRLADEEFRKRFRDAFCKAIPAAPCQARYEGMINARLEQRYYAADQASVARTCDATPGRCDDPVAYEMLLLDSHNARVLQEGARAELRIEDERRRAHAADVSATLESTTEIAGEVAYHLHQGPKCRSFPNVFGGANTICSDGQR